MSKRLRDDGQDDDYQPSPSTRPKRPMRQIATAVRRASSSKVATTVLTAGSSKAATTVSTAGSSKAATIVSTAGSSKAATIVSTADPSRAPSILSQGLGNIHDSSEKSLPAEGLVQEVSKMVHDKDRAELMILDLMREYSFSFPRLKELLRGKFEYPRVTLLNYIRLIVAAENNLEVSFSKVKYKDIAPRLGLDPLQRGSDICPFDMFRARLPNVVFNKIAEDLRVFSAQYGNMDEHENEEARARFLSAVSTPGSFESSNIA